MWGSKPLLRLLTAALFTTASVGHADASHAHVAPPIVGTVADTAGMPLPNVQLVVEGTRRSTLSDSDGRFVLTGLAAGSYHLSASLIGYLPAHLEVAVPEDGDDIVLRISLVPSPLALEGILVTGSPTASNPLTVTHSTVQLSGRELDRNIGGTVAATLASEPGIAVRYGGPAASVPVIRGLTGERVVMLENGQRTGDLAGSSSDHASTVDPLAVSRIEVVRGPASLLYGSSALGGVVNVIRSDIPTEISPGVQGWIAAQGESASPGAAGSGQISLPLGESIAVLMRGGGRTADDVRIGGGGNLENTDVANLHGDVGVGYVGRSLTGGVAVGSYGFDYGLPAAPDAEEAGVRIEGRRNQAKARAALVTGNSAVTDAHIDGSAQWYTHDEVEDSGEIGTTFKLNTQTVDLRASTRFGGSDGALGASTLTRQYEPTGEEALTPPANSSSVGAFVYQEIPILGLGHESDEHAPRIQLGARYDLYRIRTAEADEKFGAARTVDFGSFSGSAGVNVPLSHEASLGVSVARAFRAPTVEELFSNAIHAATGTFERGNPNLGQETNFGIESVFRAQLPAVQTQLSAYYNRISDYISPILSGTVSVVNEEGESVDIPLTDYGQMDASLVGVEGQIQAIPAPNIVIGAMGDIVRGEFTGGATIPFMPAARLGGSARYDDGRISGELELRHAFSQRQVAQNEFGVDSYNLLDANLSYSLRSGGRQHVVTLRAENILDAQYREATSRIKEFAPNPGFNLSGVYRVYF